MAQKVTFQFDKIKPSEKDVPVDAFEVMGFRLLMLRLMRQTISDMTDEDPEVRQEAQEWFESGDIDPRTGERRQISFNDCATMIGLSSRLKEMRDMVLSGDRNTHRDLISQMSSQIITLNSLGRDKLRSDNLPEHAPSFDKETTNHLTMAFR